ncbi:hypothetical protein [Clostridium gasigenes]|uniref:hypothetical protein n=1 Tax=Clostridium gasigenes TaxID=94869 RepID=UPI00209AC96B|nr:hypothetical protein [Clostridium gasigenes]
MKEIKKLLCDKNADNIICRELDLKPSNIAMYITSMANNSNAHGYIIIGASKNEDIYTVNGISGSLKIDSVIQAALKQLSIQPIVEHQKCLLEGKNVWIIYVKKYIKDISASNNIKCIEQKEEYGSIKKLLKDLLLAYIKLQRNYLYKNVTEDERNDFIRDLLETNGYQVKDQTRQGTSNSGKSSGEVDILIQEQGFPFAIIEALNLSSLDTNYLDTHIDKIYKYDTLGNSCNFIVSYVKVKDFGTFWDKYTRHIKQHKYPYKLIGIEESIGEKYSYTDIRLLMTKHDRNGKDTLLYHICVKMQS